jgi:hypothetical protein
MLYLLLENIIRLFLFRSCLLNIYVFFQDLEYICVFILAMYVLTHYFIILTTILYDDVFNV